MLFIHKSNFNGVSQCQKIDPDIIYKPLLKAHTTKYTFHKWFVVQKHNPKYLG